MTLKKKRGGESLLQTNNIPVLFLKGKLSQYGFGMFLDRRCRGCNDARDGRDGRG